jgi:hypothetical protein
MTLKKWSLNKHNMQKYLLIILLSTITAACSIPSSKIDRSHDTYHPQTSEDKRGDDMKSLITKSDEPWVIFGGKKKSDGAAIGNSYLWKAAIESISFMPLVSVDSNGGVIITDWYKSPGSRNERLKFNIFILKTNIQLGSIKITAFRQVEHLGSWRSAEVSKELAEAIEDNILKKAISLRAQNEGN